MQLTTTQLATITAVGAAVVPLVTSFLKKEHWPTWVKQLIALVMSALVAVVGIAITVTNWSAVSIATLIGLAFTGSQVVYQAYFRGSAFDSFLTDVFGFVEDIDPSLKPAVPTVTVTATSSPVVTTPAVEPASTSESVPSAMPGSPSS